MSLSVIGTIPPGGLGGAEAPPMCRPPSFLVQLKWTEVIQKVASILLKIAKQVAHG